MYQKVIKVGVCYKHGTKQKTANPQTQSNTEDAIENEPEDNLVSQQQHGTHIKKEEGVNIEDEDEAFGVDTVDEGEKDDNKNFQTFLSRRNMRYSLWIQIQMTKWERTKAKKLSDIPIKKEDDDDVYNVETDNEREEESYSTWNGLNEFYNTTGKVPI